MISQATNRDDISELGRRIYREQIEPNLTPDDQNRFVVIDVDTGDYEIADQDIDATLELMKRRKPGRFYAVCVGRRAAYSLLTPFNHRLHCNIAAGHKSAGDTTTLEDYSVLAKLRESEEG